MALKLAIADAALDEALAPLSQAFPRGPQFLVTDQVASVVPPETQALALSREKWAQLCASGKDGTGIQEGAPPAFHHVLVYDTPAFVHERTLRTLTRLEKLATGSPSAFGVEPLLRPGFQNLPSPHPVHDKRTICNRAQKVHALEDLIEFTEGLRASLQSFSSHFVSYAIEVQEELLCNAIWDANPRLRKAPRDGDFELSPNEAVELEWGFDGQYLAISVTDPFGTFPESLLPRYFRALFETKASHQRNLRTESEGPGAGVGLYMLLERATVLCLTLESGRRTEMAAILNLAQGSRGLMRGTHSFQFFRIQPGASHGTRQEG